MGMMPAEIFYPMEIYPLAVEEFNTKASSAIHPRAPALTYNRGIEDAEGI
ncbi:Uncharacterised protein [uncultured archaeon]|nr:Uncharacterised protein [uncultured archaeon]